MVALDGFMSTIFKKSQLVYSAYLLYKTAEQILFY